MAAAAGASSRSASMLWANPPNGALSRADAMIGPMRFAHLSQERTTGANPLGCSFRSCLQSAWRVVDSTVRVIASLPKDVPIVNLGLEALVHGLGLCAGLNAQHDRQ